MTQQPHQHRTSHSPGTLRRKLACLLRGAVAAAALAGLAGCASSSALTELDASTKTQLEAFRTEMDKNKSDLDKLGESVEALKRSLSDLDKMAATTQDGIKKTQAEYARQNEGIDEEIERIKKVYGDFPSRLDSLSKTSEDQKRLAEETDKKIIDAQQSLDEIERKLRESVSKMTDDLDQSIDNLRRQVNSTLRTALANIARSHELIADTIHTQRAGTAKLSEEFRRIEEDARALGKKANREASADAPPPTPAATPATEATEPAPPDSSSTSPTSPNSSAPSAESTATDAPASTGSR